MFALAHGLKAVPLITVHVSAGIDAAQSGVGETGGAGSGCCAGDGGGTVGGGGAAGTGAAGGEGTGCGAAAGGEGAAGALGATGSPSAVAMPVGSLLEPPHAARNFMQPSDASEAVTNERRLRLIASSL